MKKKRIKSKQIQEDQHSFKELYTRTKKLMKKNSSHSFTKTELLHELKLPKSAKILFNDVLQELLKNQTIELEKRRYIFCLPKPQILEGTLRVHPRGFGFLQVKPPSPYSEDIFIPKSDINHAIDGDTVQVLVNTTFISEKGPEGKVITILNRGRTHLTGIITYVDKKGSAFAYTPLLQGAQNVRVKKTAKKALKVGDRAYLKVLKWGSKDEETVSSVEKMLPPMHQPQGDIPTAILEQGLQEEFHPDTLKEAKAYGTRIPSKEIAKRTDLRDLVSVTIDPTTAKDFDDALSLTKERSGDFHLGVHIADVSHYVKPGSKLDIEAKNRCNSTYFPGMCLPMLPKDLSENLCSLKPLVNRLTLSVMMRFNKEGDLIGYEILRSIIRSKKRFTYREAKQVLDGKKKSPHKKMLKMMVTLCQLLKKKRHERGSIEFALPDLRVICNKKGVPTGTELIEYDITHQLVEEFMLKANEVVAQHLSKKKHPLSYRVHEEPQEENMNEFVSLAHSFGFRLPKQPTPKDLQKLFDEALHTPHGPYLAVHFIRKMRMAIYSPDNIGHFGLSLSHYTHFTSPIRRYIDLVIHRILFGLQEKKENLDLISLHCSEKERISARAENSVILLKKLRLLNQYYKEDPYRDFSALVTSVKPFGLVFEVLDFMLEGFLHVSELDNDYFIFDEKSATLKGRYRQKQYSVGTPLTVMIKDVNLIHQKCEWHFVADKVIKKKRKKR